MKESRYKDEKGLIFRETFNDEQSVRKNGGVPTNVTFEEGKAIYGDNLTTSKSIKYTGFKNKVPQGSTFFYRIRFSFELDKPDFYIMDFYSSDAFRTYIRRTNGISALANVNILYINGNLQSDRILSDSYAGQEIEIVFQPYAFDYGTNDGTVTLFNWGGGLANSMLHGTVDLIEVYESLTAEEIKNLYNNARYSDVNPNHAEQLGEELINTLHNSAIWPLDNVSFNGSDLIASDAGGSLWSIVTDGITVVEGEQYRVTWDSYTQNSGTAPKIEFQDSLGGVGSATSNVITSLTENSYILTIITSGTSYFEIGERSTATDFSFTGLSLKKVVVNDTKEILNVNSFGGSVVNKYAGDVYGDEKVLDTGFDNPSNWTLGTGWSVTGSKVVADASAYANMFQSSSLTVGKVYEIQLDVVVNSGLLQVGGGGSETVGFISTSGHHRIVYTCTNAGNGRLYLGAYATFNGTVDNFSWKEVIPEPTLTDTTVVKDGDVYTIKYENDSTSEIDCGDYWDGTGDCTILAWVKVNDPKPFVSSTYRPTLLFNNKLLLKLIRLAGYNRIVFNRNASDTIIPDSTFEFNKYFLIGVVSKSDGTSDTYINGSLQKSGFAAGTPVAGTTNTRLGSEEAKCLVQPHTRIIDGLLTAEEISAIFSSERSKYGL